MTPPKTRLGSVHPKLAAAGVAGAVTILLVWVAGLFGLVVPAEPAQAFTVIVSALAGYVKSSA